VRPSRLWKDLSPETRLAAAEALWRDEDTAEARGAQIEALAGMAKRLNFRMKSVSVMPIERRARLLAQMRDVSDVVAGRALVALHFASRRPLMAAFLDALGLEHDNGLITAETVDPPDRERLLAAIETVSGTYPAEDVALYLRTLVALDEDTWSNLEGLQAAAP